MAKRGYTVHVSGSLMFVTAGRNKQSAWYFGETFARELQGETVTLQREEDDEYYEAVVDHVWSDRLAGSVEAIMPEDRVEQARSLLLLSEDKRRFVWWLTEARLALRVIASSPHDAELEAYERLVGFDRKRRKVFDVDTSTIRYTLPEGQDAGLVRFEPYRAPARAERS